MWLKYKYENLGNETLSVKIKEKENIETSPKELKENERKNAEDNSSGFSDYVIPFALVFLFLIISNNLKRSLDSKNESLMKDIRVLREDTFTEILNINEALCNKQLKLSEDIRKGINSIKLLIVQNNTSFIYSNIDGTNKYLLPETKYMLLANNLNTLNDLKKVSESELKALGFKPKIIKNLKNYLAEIGLKLSGNDKEQDSPNDEENRQMSVER